MLLYQQQMFYLFDFNLKQNPTGSILEITNFRCTFVCEPLTVSAVGHSLKRTERVAWCNIFVAARVRSTTGGYVFMGLCPFTGRVPPPPPPPQSSPWYHDRAEVTPIQDGTSYAQDRTGDNPPPPSRQAMPWRHTSCGHEGCISCFVLNSDIEWCRNP